MSELCVLPTSNSEQWNCFIAKKKKKFLRPISNWNYFNMDQPKIERLLRFMKLLTGNISYSINDLSERLDMSVRFRKNI